MKIYWSLRGAHIHCRIFYHGLAGTLVFAEDEWPEVGAMFSRIGELIKEG